MAKHIKKKTKKAIISLFIVIIILILLLVILYSLQFKIFNKFYNENNAMAEKIYNINKNNKNFIGKSNIFFEEKAQKLIDDYKENLISYEQLENEVAKFKKYDDFTNKIGEIKIQKEKYEQAEKFLEDKDYKQALPIYNELNGTYLDLAEKQEECKKELKNSVLAEVNTLKDNKNYSDAINKLNEVKEYYENDEEVKNTLSDLEKLQNEQKNKEEENKRIDEIKSSIKIIKIWSSSPNSAGGVDLYINWKNLSDKVIKYAYFTVVPYNSVNDIVTCSIRHYSRFTAQDEGPYSKGKGNSGTSWYWENAWYNYSIKRVELKSVQIEYMDGTSLEIPEEYINYIK